MALLRVIIPLQVARGRNPIARLVSPRPRRGWLRHLGKEVPDGLADLGRGVLLDEVTAPHGDLPLVRPGAAEPALRTLQDDTWVRVDEELGQAGDGQPVPVAADDFGHVGGLAI